MAERSIAAVLKTVIQKCIGGSNPSVSAEKATLKGCFYYVKRLGEMPEWSNGAVSKTVERYAFQGFESLSLRDLDLRRSSLGSFFDGIYKIFIDRIYKIMLGWSFILLIL